MSRRGLMLFALLSVLWGVPYLLISIALVEVSVPFLVFARSALGAAVLIPLALARSGFASVRACWRPVLAFAVIEMLVPWGLIVHGETQLNSSMAALLVATTPIIAVVLSKLQPGTAKLTTSRIIGLVMGLAGVGLLAAPELRGDAVPVVAILAAAFCYAIGSMIAERWLGGVSSIPMTAACLAIAAAAYAIPAIESWPTHWPSWRTVVAITLLGVACTAIAFASFFLLIREVGSERAVVITYVAPAVAVAAGVTLLDEPFDGRVIAAFTFVICGSWLANRTNQQAAEGVSKPVSQPNGNA